MNKRDTRTLERAEEALLTICNRHTVNCEKCPLCNDDGVCLYSVVMALLGLPSSVKIKTLIVERIHK